MEKKGKLFIRTYRFEGHLLGKGGISPTKLVFITYLNPGHGTTRYFTCTRFLEFNPFLRHSQAYAQQLNQVSWKSDEYSYYHMNISTIGTYSEDQSLIRHNNSLKCHKVFSR